MNFIYKFTFHPQLFLLCNFLQSYLIKNFMGRWFIAHHTAWRHQNTSILLFNFTSLVVAFRSRSLFALARFLVTSNCLWFFFSGDFPTRSYSFLCCFSIASARCFYVVDIINFHIWLKSLVSSSQIELWKFTLLFSEIRCLLHDSETSGEAIKCSSANNESNSRLSFLSFLFLLSFSFLNNN